MEISASREALVIGIDDYPSDPLACAVADAKEMAAILQMKEYGFHVNCVLNKTATRRTIIEAIKALMESAAEIKIVYFSGHGTAADTGAYLVTVDADSLDPGVDLAYLKRLMDKPLVKHASSIVLILDCCHSGAATLRGQPASHFNIRSTDIGEAIPNLGEGRVLLAACRADEVALETTALGHGVFTFQMLEGLQGEGADQQGTVTISSLYHYVATALERLGGKPPVFRGDLAGSIVLGRGLPAPSQKATDKSVLERIQREAKSHIEN